MKIEISALRIAYATQSDDLARLYITGIWVHSDRIHATNGCAAIQCLGAVSENLDPDPIMIKLDKRPPARKSIVAALFDDGVVRYVDKKGETVDLGTYTAHSDYTPPVFSELYEKLPESAAGKFGCNVAMIAQWQKDAGVEHVAITPAGDRSMLVVDVAPGMRGLLMPVTL